MRTIQAECTVVRDVLCPRNMPQRLTESQGARNVQRDVELCSREFEIMYVGAARKYSFIDKKKKNVFYLQTPHCMFCVLRRRWSNTGSCRGSNRHHVCRPRRDGRNYQRIAALGPGVLVDEPQSRG